MTPINMTYEDKAKLAGIVIGILDTWEVGTAQQISLLSLPDKTPLRAIRKYRKAETPFPENDILLEKIEHLIGIIDALRTTFPRNDHIRAQWMNKPHKRFSGRSPLQIMMNDGVKGFITVRAQLDCAFACENYYLVYNS